MSEKERNGVWSIPKFRETISKIGNDSALQLQIFSWMVCSDSPNTISKVPNMRRPTPEKGLRRIPKNFDFGQFNNNLEI